MPSSDASGSAAVGGTPVPRRLRSQPPQASPRIADQIASSSSSPHLNLQPSPRKPDRCLTAHDASLRRTNHSATLACFVSGSASSASVASTRDLMSGLVLTPADVVNAVNAQNLTLPSGTQRLAIPNTPFAPMLRRPASMISTIFRSRWWMARPSS